MANSVIVSMVGNRGKSVEKKWTDTESFYNELSFYFRLKSVLNHDDWFVLPNIQNIDFENTTITYDYVGVDFEAHRLSDELKNQLRMVIKNFEKLCQELNIVPTDFSFLNGDFINEKFSIIDFEKFSYGREDDIFNFFQEYKTNIGI
jgi:hypothetical protein|tara:strand:- start:221 stop:661 length:441 start_codon:yes stop_codon:yes gene_type:complete